ITIILLVVGFAIAFYFLVMFDWTGNIDQEVCHQSVIYRATLPSIAGAKEYVPLKCKTDKICITSGIIGGDCDEFENLDGVAKAKVNSVKEIEKIIAGEIVDCWTMMGEGKVLVFDQWLAREYGVGDVGSSCVVCNRIAFDKEGLANAGIDLSEMDVMEYMQTHAVPDKDVSYYAYLSGGGGMISIKDNLELPDIKENEKNEIIEGDKISIDLEDFSEENPLGTEELSIVFMQITAPKHFDTFRNAAVTLFGSYGVSFIVSPKLATKSTLALLKSPWTWAMVAIMGAYQQGSVSYNRAVTSGYCGDVSAGDEARDGCSVVRTINYNAEDISQYCSIIESIP
ncbi:MAG: hypothetical protein WCX73_05140, partial [Candidatus Pacearchaeota archaeon]